MLMPTRTGFVDFFVPAADRPCKTWYAIYGELSPSKPPVVVLAGGPGVPHNYLLPLADIYESHHVPVIFYDALGCGQSTHLPEKKGDESFWTISLFLAELDNLLAGLGISHAYHLTGQSWGGAVGACHALQQPRGLQKLILMSAPADMHSWTTAGAQLRAGLPRDVQGTLMRAANEGATEDPEYLRAARLFWEKHLCRVAPMPKEVDESIKGWKSDMTVYSTMNGPSEFFVTGSLKEWSIVEQLDRIIVPTLLINGRYDEAQDNVVRPFSQRLGTVTWVQFAQSSHMPQWEERAKFGQILGDFISS